VAAHHRGGRRRGKARVSFPIEKRSPTHAFGLPLPDRIVVDAAVEVAAARAAAGLPPPRDAGLYTHGAIEIAPPALLAATPHPVRGPRVLRQRPASVTG